jgi:hypothetical protein
MALKTLLCKAHAELDMDFLRKGVRGFGEVPMEHAWCECWQWFLLAGKGSASPPDRRSRQTGRAVRWHLLSDRFRAL